MNDFAEYVESLDRPLFPPKEPNPMGEPGQYPLEEAVVGTVEDITRHPWRTTGMTVAMLPQMYTGMGLLPSFAKGAGIEAAGAMMDEGFTQAGELGKQLVQNPGDMNHMLRGLGMEIKRLPSRAADMGRSLWNTLTKPIDYSKIQPQPTASSSTQSSTQATSRSVGRLLPAEWEGKYEYVPKLRTFGE